VEGVIVDPLFLHRKFCFLAEDDRDKVAAAITPLWVIRDDNIAVEALRRKKGVKKAAFPQRKTAFS
jgi:hypothetical protein